ncbi:uncharacterized protein LOC109846489 isoform X2 [Asparagus officinalis]|uniref:uncharacterized protein LOC109846489 isoform X2 n=1 Tax=Asparagus officinalis TaxID=4686 RepID=UPI00098E765C|nr:uncharacterized protein LOC109846489 isoform X2 [Asparagus officinalis]
MPWLAVSEKNLPRFTKGERINIAKVELYEPVEMYAMQHEGKGIERLVTQLGHAISVPIPSSSGAPEGEHATSLANEIGKEIRSSALVRNCGWDNIDAGSREAIIMRVRELGFEYLESREQLVMTLQANWNI